MSGKGIRNEWGDVVVGERSPHEGAGKYKSREQPVTQNMLFISPEIKLRQKLAELAEVSQSNN